MNQLIAALVNLINTGSALADDALYLFILLKIVQSVAISFSVAYPIIVVARRLFACIEKVHGTEQGRLDMRALEYASRSQYHDLGPDIAKRVGLERKVAAK